MNGIVGRFLSFDKMIAGTIIKFLYYIVLAVILLAGIVTMFQALFAGQFVRFLLTPIAAVLMILFVRVLFEMYIVIFRISDNLAAIRKLKEDGSSTAS